MYAICASREWENYDSYENYYRDPPETYTEYDEDDYDEDDWYDGNPPDDYWENEE